MKAFDNALQQEIDIPDNELPQRIVEGNISLPAGTKLKVFDPVENKREEIDAQDAYKFFSAGFQYVSPEQEREEKINEEFGNRPIEAAGLGFARGLSFGLSDQLLKEFIGEEELRGIEEANSVASGIGEIASLLVPTGEAGLLLKGTSKAGQMASKAVARGLGVKATDKLVEKALKRAAEVGAGSAVEGGLYGAGHLISEDALGRADINAENVLTAVGTGAVLGGVLGGTIGASKELGGAGIEKARDTLTKAYNRMYPKQADPIETLASFRSKIIDDATGEVKQLLTNDASLGGLLKKDIIDVERSINNVAKMMDKKKVSLKELPQFQKELKELKSYQDDVLNAHQGLKEGLIGREFGYAYKKNISSLDDLPFVASSVAKQTTKVKKFADIDENEFLKIINSKPEEVGSLSLLAKKYYEASERFLSKADEVYSLTKLKKIDAHALRGLIEGNRKNFGTYVEAQKLKTNLEMLSDYVKKGNKLTPEILEQINRQLEKVSNPPSKFIKGDELLNRDGIYLAREIEKQIRNPLKELHKQILSPKTIAEKVSADGHLLDVMVSGLGSSLKGALGFGFALSRINPQFVGKHILALERATQNVRSRISTKAKEFVAGPRKTLPSKLGIMSYDFQLKTKPKEKETAEQSFKRITADIDEAMDNPYLFAQIGEWAGDLGKVAPKTSEEIAKKALFALEYLHNEIPRPMGNQMASNIKIKPTQTEMRQFLKKVAIIFKPAETIDLLLDGKLGNDEIQVFKKVNPLLVEQIKEQIVAELKDKPLPYQKRLLLSQIFDVPMAVGLEKDILASIQNSYQMEEEKKEEAKKISVKSKSFETSSQKIIG